MNNFTISVEEDVSQVSFGDLKITIDSEGHVRVKGALSVAAVFSLGYEKKHGEVTVTTEKGAWDLDVVLRGDKDSPLKKARPLALVLDLDEESGRLRVYAQDGIGDWSKQITLFPPPRKK